MALKVYNTLTNKKEKFVPIHPKEVGIYLCGPTVNDVPHLGHARVQVVFDVFRRYLQYLGYKVKFVSNITDIEDKIIAKANEQGISIKELTEKNIKEHMEDYASLNVIIPDFQPKATEYVPQMIELVKLLEKKGHTYVVPEDGVYFKVESFKDYGHLSNFKLDSLKSKRKLRNETKGKEKIDEKDFVLWKFSKEGEPCWESPWGAGRPGWHIECSTMTHEILGNPFDIHCGGQDLIFPHHEDEIAQSEAGYGQKMANYWMHNGMVNVNKVKMSKSLGNFKTIKDLLKKYSGREIRYFVINNHYRKPIDFSISKLDEAKTSLERLKGLCNEITDDREVNETYLGEFEEEMNEDLNSAGALNVLWKLVRDKDAKGKYQAIQRMDQVFGLDLLKKEELKIPKEVEELVGMRENARKNKEWKKSDELRDKINSLGYNISDTPEGAKLTKI